MMQQHTLSLYLYTTFLLQITVFTDAQVSLVGDNVTLTCISNTTVDFVQFTWTDEVGGSSTYILTVGKGGVLRKSTDQKYQNFVINNNNTGFPESTRLIIEDIQLVDELGPYRCSPSVGGTGTPQLFHIQLEDVPDSVSINCTRETVCPSSADDETSALFTCSCTAVAAYPESLLFNWTGATQTVSTTPSNSSAATGFFDFYGEATITPNDVLNEVTCLLTGYSSSINQDNRNATYTFAPSMCSLSMSFDNECSRAFLSCSCIGGSPQISQYSYSYENNTVLAVSGLQDQEVDIVPSNGTNHTFHCTGCNGIYYGPDSTATSTSQCIIIECPEFYYGPHCNMSCDCDKTNTEKCDSVDGTCLCNPGFKGSRCENECDPFSYGDGCSGNCMCNRDRSTGCSHVNGTCFCLSGYTGDRCNDVCVVDVCENGAACEPEDSDKGYTCNCVNCFNGALCELMACDRPEVSNEVSLRISEGSSCTKADTVVYSSGTRISFLCKDSLKELDGSSTSSSNCINGTWHYSTTSLSPQCKTALWFIIVLVVVGVLVVVALAVAIYCFCQKKKNKERLDGEDGKYNSAFTGDGGGGADDRPDWDDIDTKKETDKPAAAAEPPIYAESTKRKKSTKKETDEPASAAEPPIYAESTKRKKSQKSRDNGTPDPHVPMENSSAYEGVEFKGKSQPEAEPKELQYAELEHKTIPAGSEIIQSPDEPTPYADIKGTMEDVI